MRIFAVGDIQGCYSCLRRLLDKAGFRPDCDQLWCVGDLVNRGPDSLKTLQFLRDMGDHCIAVLGNHDLHLLRAAANGTPPPPTLQQVIDAKESQKLITWLRHRPLLHHNPAIGWAMVHAGLHPAWSLPKAKKRAALIEQQLQSKQWKKKINLLLTPSNNLSPKKDNLPFALSIFTRSRFCTAEGNFNWSNSSNQAGTDDEQPWFAHPNARWRIDKTDADPRNARILFGHWAAKGIVDHLPHVLGLDSGCVWGKRLTLARIDQPSQKLISVACTSNH